MSMTQWWKVATVLLVAGATASGVEWLGHGSGPGTQTPAAKPDQDIRVGEAPTREVKPGKLRFTVNERGYVEAAQAIDVYCNVEKGSVILKLTPEGQRVKKGEVVAELYSSALKDQLINQRITTKTAEANFVNAKLTREVAEIAVREYRDILQQEEGDLKRAIDGGRAAIRKTEERRERVRAAGRRVEDMLRAAGGSRNPAEVSAEVDIQDRIEEAELSLDRERRSLAQAEGKWEILHKYTAPKTIKALEGEVDKAHSNELARQATWELEKSREQKLERQIANCNLYAPIDGCVVYANDPSRLATRAQYRIEEGATVRERQKIVSIVDFNGPMQINVKVPEKMIGHVVPKMKARIKIDAFPNETITGLVSEVAPLPAAGTFLSPDIRVYTTRIRIGGGRPNVRPGMTATAEMVVVDRDDVISVPVKAVVHYEGKDHVAVKGAASRVEWRDVVLGVSDGSIVEVTEGLRDGEQVILEAEALLSDEQRARRDAVIDPFGEKAAAPAKGRSIARPRR
jgi:RND family efflux transporter MFP subunit